MTFTFGYLVVKNTYIVDNENHLYPVSMSNFTQIYYDPTWSLEYAWIRFLFCYASLFLLMLKSIMSMSTNERGKGGDKKWWIEKIETVRRKR